jgi:hypothetical protein
MITDHPEEVGKKIRERKRDQDPQRCEAGGMFVAFIACAESISTPAPAKGGVSDPGVSPGKGAGDFVPH